MTSRAALCLLEVLRHLKGVIRAVEKWATEEAGQTSPVETHEDTSAPR